MNPLLNRLKPLHRRWPERMFLVSKEPRVLYAPIMKNACTTWKTWLLQLDQEELGPGQDVHTYSRQSIQLRGTDTRFAREVLSCPDMLRFAVVRNPWSRLVSAFSDKVVRKPYHGAISLMLGHGLWRYQRDHESLLDGTSFRDFVHAVCHGAPHRHDSHWRPQHHFLGDYKFHLIGRFEDLPALLDSLNERLGLETGIVHRNASSSRTSGSRSTVTSPGELADIPASELRALNPLPAYPAFYDTELMRMVSDYYRQDIARFGYTFLEETPAALSAAS